MFALVYLLSKILYMRLEGIHGSEVWLFEPEVKRMSQKRIRFGPAGIPPMSPHRLSTMATCIGSATRLAYCMKADTGEVIYKEKLEAKGGKSFYASMVFADGKLYAPSRTSGTFVLAAKPAFELISQNVFDSDQSDFNGSAAISDSKVFLRSNEALYCIATDETHQ